MLNISLHIKNAAAHPLEVVDERDKIDGLKVTMTGRNPDVLSPGEDIAVFDAEPLVIVIRNKER